MLKRITNKILKLFFKFPKDELFFKLYNLKLIKFNIGSGKSGFNYEWFNTDKNSLDITDENDWKKYLKFLKVNNVFSEHVWEHLSDIDSEKALKNCYRFLKKGGVFRIAVPDGFHPDKNYIDYVKPGGHGLGAEDHKILYNYKSLTQRLESAGFKVTLLEYWDENGNFHFREWSDDGGRVLRSKRYDSRNQNGKLAYTSLIIDAIK
ncbi:MAG: class I SAM-dependent methyltransferase [Bacteroidota bacterium]